MLLDKKEEENDFIWTAHFSSRFVFFEPSSLKTMKFSSFSAAIFALNAGLFSPNSAQALKCGTAITKDCIGDEDIRYDADASNDLADQADVWKILPGLYIEDSYFYDNKGEPIKLDNETGFLSFPLKSFTNITVSGSRFYMHQYLVANNAYTGVGGCLLADGWYTSTFEKDGSAQALSIRNWNDNNTVFKATNPDLRLFPVNDRTVYGSGESSSTGAFLQQSTTCANEVCDALLRSSETSVKGKNGQPTLNTFSRSLNSIRVDEEEFISTMNALFDEYNIPFDNSFGYPFMRPADVSTAECASGVCPSEEDWQTIDPNFNKSPYQEPDASLTAGFIAGITIASFAIVAAIAYMYHRHIVNEREQRLKTSFARAVAATINTRATAGDLSPEDLKNEFDSIDTDENGTVSKEELRSFFADSSVVEIDDKDFDVLFASIDLDGNAILDFSEFCSFFAYIRGDFDTAIKSKSVRNMRKSTMNATTSEDA